ncbi:hypothetical protein [Bacillus atrophaeus]|uniref:hypothetical protein n=1 Tax=Bacillus atrophaeus TaxID=1452 RepID=UPI002280C598|nr:hypothetical protein [Bacillus atrophaeus]MCY8958225.1 hypothetical protein [Bacillus atrophaeus]MCY8963798.1 hypothetical protein [Bacillus atrophaeus]MCY9440182.1 hypothetical protein [Bacillus atrophaeus]MEC0648462.1 hypothetical protein [Bacillus atrophaeus]
MTETNANANVKSHVLAEETLGGIKCEYVEVDRKAKVSEKIVIVDADVQNEEPYDNGDIFKVEKKYGLSETARTKCNRFILDTEYRVLEPTDIVHINGQRYKMVDRKAEVGEKVIHMYESKSDGIARKTIKVDATSVEVDPFVHNGGVRSVFAHGYYRVLVPLDEHKNTIENKNSAYKELKNLIHNELGISRQDVQEMISTAVSNEVKKMSETGDFYRIASTKIDSLIEEGFGDGGRLLYDFKERVSHTVSDEVGKRIANNLNINVELKGEKN